MKRTRAIIMAGIAATLIAIEALAGAMPASAIDNGTDDVNTPAANAVVKIIAPYLGSSVLCSGTLITRNTVLTAGHCIEEKTRGTDDPPHPPQPNACSGDWQYPGRWYPVRDTVRVFIGNGSGTQQTRTVSEYALPVCADMIMLKLSLPVPASVAVPIPVLANFGDSDGAADAARLAGAEFDIAGFGQDETGALPALRQRGRVRYSGHSDEKIFVAPIAGAFPNLGDSGSPLLWRSPSGVRYVVGVNQTNTGWYTPTFRGVIGPKPAISNFFNVANPYALYCPPVMNRPVGVEPLVSWWSGGRQDNLVAGAPGWAGCSSALRSPDYAFTATEGYLFSASLPAVPGTIPLHTWYSGARGDHWTTTQHAAAGIAHLPLDPGYGFVRLEGYVYDPARPQPPGTVGLYSWMDPVRGDNWITTQHQAEGRARADLSPNYHFVRLEGYVVAP